LHKLLHNWVLRVDDLESRDVGATSKDFVQAHVGKPLRSHGNKL
jgi:hypothetical protein